MNNLTTILNHMSEAMLITNPKGNIMFFNRVMKEGCEAFQKPLQKGMSILDLASPARHTLVENILEQITQEKRAQMMEAEYKLPDGKMMYYEVTYSPVLDSENEVEQICVVSRDITTQKTFEHKTVTLLRDLQNLIETANAVIFGVDVGGNVTEWNQETVKLTGYEKGDVYTHSIVMLVDQTKAQSFEEMLAKVLAGKPVSNFEIRVKTKSGRLLSLLLNATPRLNSSGHVVGSLFVGQDISELTTYRSSLEQKVKDRTQELIDALRKEKELVEMKNRFVSIASHEFRVPLGSIRSTVEVLKRSSLLSAQEQEKLQHVERQVTHMNVLLEDVLTVGKNETTKLKANLVSVELITFLKVITEEVLSNVKYSHRVLTVVPDVPVVLDSDERLLRNIFINLIANAIKFSPGKEEIHLTIELTAGRVHVIVRDFGIGISEEDRQRVFEPFNRGSNANHIKGTGLGLSIVKKAVETLGGDLSVESKVGSGTTFTVFFKHISI